MLAKLAEAVGGGSSTEASGTLQAQSLLRAAETAEDFQDNT